MRANSWESQNSMTFEPFTIIVFTLIEIRFAYVLFGEHSSQNNRTYSLRCPAIILVAGRLAFCIQSIWVMQPGAKNVYNVPPDWSKAPIKHIWIRIHEITATQMTPSLYFMHAFVYLKVCLQLPCSFGTQFFWARVNKPGSSRSSINWIVESKDLLNSRLHISISFSWNAMLIVPSRKTKSFVCHRRNFAAPKSADCCLKGASIAGPWVFPPRICTIRTSNLAACSW